MNPVSRHHFHGPNVRVRRWLKRVIPYLCIYVGLVLLVTLFQRRLIYHPTVLTPTAAEAWAGEEDLER